MSRVLLAASLAVAAVGATLTAPLSADRTYRSHLDREGKSFGSSWSATPRFDALTATGADDVRLTTGDSWRIRATGDPRALAQLRFLVEDGALIVGRLSKQPQTYGKARIEITAPSLRTVVAAGSGTVDVERIGGSRASATVAGSGRTTVRTLHVERLDATIAGSGALVLSGRTETAHVTIAGSGALSAGGFIAQSAKVTVAGSGTARFHSPGQVQATIAGSGTVEVTGTTDCRQTRMGSGRLICRR